MQIVIDCRNTYNNDTALGGFTRAFWLDTAAGQPAHYFIFLTEGKEYAGMPSNGEFRVLKKYGFRWFDHQRLNHTIAALKADWLVQMLPAGFRLHRVADSNKNEIDLQVLFYSNGEVQPQQSPGVIYLKPAYRYVHSDMSWAAAESVKTQYSGGCSFFLFAGTIGENQQLVELLKAFSVFKKWQLSNMRLVIAGSTTGWTASLEEKILQYKYRSDVVLVKNPPRTELAQLAGAAYALMCPAAAGLFPSSLLWALQSGKAAVATDTATNRLVTSAALWVAPDDSAAGFAKAMILLYKDEQQQQLLAVQAKEQATQYQYEQMLAAVWKYLE